MDVILEFFAYSTTKIDSDTILQANVLDRADIPQVLFVIPMTGSVAKPLNPLLTITTVDDKHFVANMHLYIPRSESMKRTYVDLHSKT